jgi:hypothetical protein
MIRDERAAFVAQAIAPRIDLTTLEGRLVSFRTPDIIAVEEQLEDVRSPVYTGVRSKVYTSDQSWVVRESAAVVLAAIDASVSPPSLGTVYVQDQKTTGTNGGTGTVGVWATRDLNTITSDSSSLASLAANQVDLLSGTYEALIFVPGHKVDGFMARLQNIDLATTTIFGSSGHSVPEVNSHSVIQGRFIIGVTTTFEVQMQIASSNGTEDFGDTKGFAGGTGEVYTVARFRRVA